MFEVVFHQTGIWRVNVKGINIYLKLNWSYLKIAKQNKKSVGGHVTTDKLSSGF